MQQIPAPCGNHWPTNRIGWSNIQSAAVGYEYHEYVIMPPVGCNLIPVNALTTRALSLQGTSDSDRWQ